MSDPAPGSGAYVHTPFCSAICPYCDFAVVAGRDRDIDRYCRALIAEIETDRPWCPLDAVYFGGGTPSRVPVEWLGRVIAGLRDAHGVASGAEVTLEANPEDFTAERGAALLDAGFNRVSFGAQSFDPVVLAALGRRHGPGQIVAAVGAARSAGFDNISVDLIYGTPGESDSGWEATVSKAVGAGVDHVSCYALTVEPGTELGRRVAAGAAAPDPDTQADRFASADSLLTEAGLVRYEVSNWARPGRRCAYNSLVWAQGQYLAYGNGAHRFRDGVRSRNIRHLDKYLEAIEAGRSPVAGTEPLEGWDLEVDRMFVGLRRVEGVASGPGVDAFVSDPDGARLIASGVAIVEGGRLRVADPMLTDTVLRAVVGLKGGNIGAIGIP